jgi:predicted MPP superfamily phosphohydrolase
MTTGERAGLYLFLAVSATVFLAGAGALVWVTLERVRGLAPPRSAFVRALRRTSLALAALGVACVAYGRFVEPFWPEVTHVRIATAKLRPGSAPVRVVQLSDLHSDPTARLEQRLPAIVAAERPDAIVFTGDAINGPDGLANFQACARGLAAIAPTFAVRGNWDVWFWHDVDLYGGTGVRELGGDGAEVASGDARVWICGVPVGGEANEPQALGAAPAEDFVVFLHHYPDEIYAISKDGRADLYCAGHTHGGQIALPVYGAIVTLSRFGKRFEAGLYRVDSTWLYVNRGIGMEGGSAPRVRFCARPEVTVFEIVPEG